MDNKAKRALIQALTKASVTDHPVTIKHKNKPVAVVLPVEDYQKFQAEREEKLKLMKQELDGILTLIRNYTGRQSLEEVEARLAALRREIEQEGE
ncbi:MAG: type II toxin-antitoxin system Phd/YefM family antitoxin [Anaerolineae bacterium]|nr:type II toxin-antitoxin system Phd/YefM family antitoxin [Anaerolineae bacterium]